MPVPRPQRSFGSRPVSHAARHVAGVVFAMPMSPPTSTVTPAAAASRAIRRPASSAVASAACLERGLADEVRRRPQAGAQDPRVVAAARRDAGIDEPQVGSDAAREHRDRGAAGGEGVEHLGGHGLRIRADALLRDAVVGGSYDDQRAHLGDRAAGDAGEPHGELLEPAEAALGLQQHALARACRMARRLVDRRVACAVSHPAAAPRRARAAARAPRRRAARSRLQPPTSR